MTILVSNELDRRLQQHLKAPEAGTEVVHEGASSAYRQLEPATYTKRKHDIARPFIFHASNLSPKKDPRTFLKSFSQLMKKEFALDLAIAGGRWTYEHAKSMIEELIHAPSVIRKRGGTCSRCGCIHGG